MIARFEYTPLTFKRPAGTSRGILLKKHSWLIHIEDQGITGIGECSIIPDLSSDYQSNEVYENQLAFFVEEFNRGRLNTDNLQKTLLEFPSILFGFESALLDLKNGGTRTYFNNRFSSGERKIPINGLIWMGDESYMQEQIEQKLEAGFSTIKMKIGAIDFDTEIKLLRSIRSNFDANTITLRVDANGAFSPRKAEEVLELLAKLDIHSIEQPIKAGQWEEMAKLCQSTPTPIALDEELIGVNSREKKIELLECIQPQYIILKPSLHGGIIGSREWIDLTQNRSIDWWMTSALESNIGLKAICDFTGEYDNELPQGLGTGSLYEWNFESNLTVENGTIFLR